MSSPSFPDSLTHTLNHLPHAPGVYRMFDEAGKILYVGKAKNLKKRVSSYFSKSDLSVKTRALVSQIKAIEVSITQSETEALLLESSLIKTHRPKYNVLMRDDKSYPYIALSADHQFPKIYAVRLKKKPQKGIFFGPYPNAYAVRETLNIIQKVFKIRNCSDAYFNQRTRPCLQYQIKRCTAPCTDFISPEKYNESVNDAVNFLKGKSQKIIKEFTQRMDSAVEMLAFEEAAAWRDKIQALRIVQEKQGIAHVRGDMDVIAIDSETGIACIQCVSVREGEVVGNATFFPSLPQGMRQTEAEQWQALFSSFLSHFYYDFPERIPKLIVTRYAIPEKKTFESVLSTLRGKACQIHTSPRGIKAQWYDFAQNNVKRAIEEKKSSLSKIRGRYESLLEILALSAPIKRMECFDISHTQGQETVASCVVFDDKGPNKKAYRRFNISGITPGDDYAAMEQALTRRAKYWIEKKSFPDVLIIDGGKGQVGIADRVLALFELKSIYVLGVAKGVQRKAGMERLILAGTHQEVSLPADSEALHLIQHIRDEAHRFAITFHRKRRQKSGIQSTLENIEGLGPKKRQALLKRFGGIQALSKASVAELVKVEGISNTLAIKIHAHFQQ